MKLKKGQVEKMDYRIGIDPGISGAIALIEINGDTSKVIDVMNMPIMQNGKHQQVNCAELTRWMKSTAFIHYPANVYLEQVQAMPGQGVVSMFNFGMSYGMACGVVLALQLPLILVRPQAWKKRAGLLHSKKDQARTKAQQLFPTVPLAHKKDIGKADAILIALYGKE